MVIDFWLIYSLGKKVTKEDIRGFIEKELHNISKDEFERLRELEPKTYIGNAAAMADKNNIFLKK